MPDDPRLAPRDWSRGPFTVSTDRARLDLDVIHGFLSTCYWAKGIPRDTVARSMKHALCFGVYENERQVGFARVVSDFSTFAYLGDVFVLESHRGRGLSKWLMECIMAHPALQELRRFFLVTLDAHSLYARFGFAPPARPEMAMEILDPDIYQRMAQGQ